MIIRVILIGNCQLPINIMKGLLHYFDSNCQLSKLLSLLIALFSIVNAKWTMYINTGITHNTGITYFDKIGTSNYSLYLLYNIIIQYFIDSIINAIMQGLHQVDKTITFYLSKNRRQNTNISRTLTELAFEITQKLLTQHPTNCIYEYIKVKSLIAKTIENNIFEDMSYLSKYYLKTL
ncbi:hypothetical protein AGLY_009649 [Aphis glycines]|uniref:Uncharacterized protein n=1 Tax=Aphis glycines TaxID=307491 RepID=A0A6G0TIN9_APHGL|nr:hypothetical protein AGLY_009649 [Aphis glycines]